MASYFKANYEQEPKQIARFVNCIMNPIEGIVIEDTPEKTSALIGNPSKYRVSGEDLEICPKDARVSLDYIGGEIIIRPTESNNLQRGDLIEVIVRKIEPSSVEK